nr:chondroitin sulfate synthase 2 [Leptinotarsa decemlineata]
MMYKGLRKFIFDNAYLFLGIIIGFYFSSMLSTPLENTCNNLGKMKNDTVQEIINSSVNKFASNITKKTNSDSKKSKLVRPRYYSTELEMREKLLVGIFTSEEKINTQAVHINKTIGHLVDKIKFFITAQYKLKTKFNLTGVVGFTDARYKYRPFQVMKYIGDMFGQDYDYYFFANDYTFINGYKLKDVIRKISVSMDVYLGVRVKESSFCSLDSGIILSNSVLKAMRNHLDWCIMNAVSEDHSENIGRCVYHSIGLSCQEAVQLEILPSFKLKHFELSSHLLELTHRDDFNKAVTIYPVLQKDDYFMLNAYFLKQRLAALNEDISENSKTLDDSWPPGQRGGSKPATRFDLPKQYYFNISKHHQETGHSINFADTKNIIEEVKSKVTNTYPKDLQYKKLVNGYKTFDLSRGMDYTLDLAFRDLNNGKEVIKRFEICKPLGNTEFIPVPYVTEGTRVNIVLSIQESELLLAMEFLASYTRLVMESKEKTFLMLVLLYQYNSASRGSADVFADIKNFATKATSKYKNDDTKIAWLSIRLPEVSNPLFIEENRALNFAVVDLALKKIGLDSLTLILDVYCNITIDFLNRVRMNTIPNFQIFSPIPFRQYNPKISQNANLEVNKNNGHFDREEYKYISFYGRDYVFARKKYQHFMPLVRIDNDIGNIIDEDHKNVGNIFNMFIKFNDKLHCLRAPEMNLKIKYHEEMDLEKHNYFLGNEAQLAKIILTKQNQISEIY